MYTEPEMSINNPIGEYNGTIFSILYDQCPNEIYPTSDIDVVTSETEFLEPSPLIIDCIEYQKNARILNSLNTEEICSYEKSSISGSLNNVVISPELKKIKNKSFDLLLNSILSEIYFQLSEYEINVNAKINVEIIKDIEIPEWDEFVISIELPLIDDPKDEKYFTIWKNIGESVEERIALTEVQDKEILEKYGMPIIILEERE